MRSVEVEPSSLVEDARLLLVELLRVEVEDELLRVEVDSLRVLLSPRLLFELLLLVLLELFDSRLLLLLLLLVLLLLLLDGRVLPDVVVVGRVALLFFL